MVPKRERNVMRRKKTFQTHLLSSKENQEIIQKAEEISKKKKEQIQIQRQKQMKEIIQNERKNKSKKKVTCQKDNVKARKLPVKRIWGGPKL